jgi:transposase
MAPKACSPALFRDYLSRRWAEGCTHGRRLFTEIQRLGYSGCYTYLARFLSPWRCTQQSAAMVAIADTVMAARDPMTGRAISPLTAAALCLKPRGQMTPQQITNLAALKAASPDFATMRPLVMRFRGILHGSDADKLDVWLEDAGESGVFAMKRFARTLQQDLDAVRNAVLERWSNGQTEGQINRLKTLPVRHLVPKSWLKMQRAERSRPPWTRHPGHRQVR